MEETYRGWGRKQGVQQRAAQRAVRRGRSRGGRCRTDGEEGGAEGETEVCAAQRAEQAGHEVPFLCAGRRLLAHGGGC